MRLPKAVDSLQESLGFSGLQARWAIRGCWRRARGQHGAFEYVELSARATQLTDRWERRWSGVDPVGYELCVEYADLWVRFHSLPKSKQYAENSAEYDEILRRHRTVLHELLESGNTADLQVIAADWDWRDLAAGWSKRHLPGAWPWRIGEVDEEDPDRGRDHFWAASGLSDAEVDSLLLAAADDQGWFVIGSPGLEWLYCPYDGGADVLLPSTVEHDALKARHAGWLPSNPRGL